MNGQRVMTYVKDLNESDAMKLINITIHLRGVCYSRYNMKRQLRVPWLAVSSLADVVVEKPYPGEPEEVSIASLAQFNSGGYYGNLVKVSGVVTLQKPDGTLFIQNRNILPERGVARNYYLVAGSELGRLSRLHTKSVSLVLDEKRAIGFLQRHQFRLTWKPC